MSNNKQEYQKTMLQTPLQGKPGMESDKKAEGKHEDKKRFPEVEAKKADSKPVEACDTKTGKSGSCGN